MGAETAVRRRGRRSFLPELPGSRPYYPESAILALKPHAGTADIDFVAGAQFLAAPITGWDFNRPAIAEDASTEFAVIVADSKLARSQMYVGMLA